jgi:hypothetical protein
MSSGIYVTIRLEPFLQDFLRAHFNCNNGVFSFPKGEDLCNKMQRLLRTLPETYKSEDYGLYNFEIEIPYMHDKDPFYYRYLSVAAQNAFVERIKDYFEEVFHERIVELRHDGHEKKECIEIFLDEHNLSIQYYDRLIKDYQRWRNRIVNQKFRNKKEKITSKKRAVLSCA